MNNGKSLETLIQQIEELLLPAGFTVERNEREYNANGVQLAEFDLIIRGSLGSTNISWLIECRDRPSDGPAPGSWIEQLVGRRDRFNFDRVTAVSTTGFAEGAAEYATSKGIELRTVESVEIDQFESWLRLEQITCIKKIGVLDFARIDVSDSEKPETKAAVKRLLTEADPKTLVLRVNNTEDKLTAVNAFTSAIDASDQLTAGLTPDGPGKSVSILAQYTDDKDHFVVDIPTGPVRVTAIQFKGTVRLERQLVKPSASKDYRKTNSDEVIAQSVSFPTEIHGLQFALEMHNIAKTGETQILLRRI